MPKFAFALLDSTSLVWLSRAEPGLAWPGLAVCWLAAAALLRPGAKLMLLPLSVAIGEARLAAPQS